MHVEPMAVIHSFDLLGLFHMEDARNVPHRKVPGLQSSNHPMFGLFSWPPLFYIPWAGQSLDCLDLPVWKFPATSLIVVSLFPSSKPPAWITESCVTPCWIRKLYMQWCTSTPNSLMPLPIWFSSSSLRFPLAIYRLVVCQFLNHQ